MRHAPYLQLDEVDEAEIAVKRVGLRGVIEAKRHAPAHGLRPGLECLGDVI